MITVINSYNQIFYMSYSQRILGFLSMFIIFDTLQITKKCLHKSDYFKFEVYVLEGECNIWNE